MTVKEIQGIFEEFGIGMASVSDLELLLAALNAGGVTEAQACIDYIKSIETSNEFTQDGQLLPTSTRKSFRSRPMLIASLYRQIIKAGGLDTVTAYSTMIPDELSGPLTMTDLQLAFVKLGDDYVDDAEAPVITLLGANPLELNVGDVYTDPGATASDNIDGDLTSSIIVGGDTVDTSTAGSYNVTYDVTDAAGNAATQVTRVVNVNPAP